MRQFYGNFNSSLFYPATLFEISGTKVPRNPLKIVYIGQLFPEKRIVDIINIVEMARNLSSLDLHLELAGPIKDTPYTLSLKEISAEKKWVSLVGGVYGIDKESFLCSGTYAIHAERDEAFGISVTEYLKAGLIPIVPDEGGTPEIVDSPELTYHTNDEAAHILVRLVSDETFRSTQLQHCAERAKIYTREAYFERQHKLLDEILQC